MSANLLMVLTGAGIVMASVGRLKRVPALIVVGGLLSAGAGLALIAAIVVAAGESW